MNPIGSEMDNRAMRCQVLQHVVGLMVHKPLYFTKGNSHPIHPQSTIKSLVMESGAQENPNWCLVKVEVMQHNCMISRWSHNKIRWRHCRLELKPYPFKDAPKINKNLDQHI